MRAGVAGAPLALPRHVTPRMFAVQDCRQATEGVHHHVACLIDSPYLSRRPATSSSGGTMAQTKRALVITSPWGDLRGTENDGRCMQSLLARYGFQVLSCHGAQATRKGILEAWQQLISSTSSGDSVAIYYSGHGGFVECAANEDNGKEWRYQFLVPVDFEDPSSGGFNGVLDVELAQLLRATTARTRNVTVILDCCYSGRMVRAPGYGDAARPKQVPSVHYEDVADFLTSYAESVSKDSNHMKWDENPDAVRVVAAAPSETAWEVRGKDGRWMGSFTSALVQVMNEAHNRRLPWRTSILRVQDLVQTQFPSQHPLVEGPHARLHFSLDEAVSDAIHLKIENGQPVLQAGRVAHVSEGDMYAVTCLDTEIFSKEDQIAVCEIINVHPFQAEGRLYYTTSNPIQEVPSEGALAFLQQSAHYRWPISAPPSVLHLLSPKVQQSRFIRFLGENELGSPLISVYHQESFIGIQSQDGMQLTTRYFNPESLTHADHVCQAVVADADRLACAQNLLGLRNGNADEPFSHQVDVKVGLVENHQPTKTLTGSGCDHLCEDQRIYISLRNDGTTTAYVSILHINVQGKISLISKSSPLGIELHAQRSHWLRKTSFGVLEGLRVSWPADLPRTRPIDEHLLLFITTSPVDLRAISDPHVTPQRTAVSKLERTMYQLCRGERRDLMDDDELGQTAYDIVHIPLTLFAREQPAAPHSLRRTGLQEPQRNCNQLSDDKYELVIPSMLSEAQDLPELPPHLLTEPKGYFNQALRRVKGVPACVWVVNEHTEAITVVVSQYRPSRLWTEASLNVSTTGAGFDLSTTVSAPIVTSIPAKCVKISLIFP
ncbi:uncharacterized protein N7446_010806 [Penicillium canescens]|uniref:uncharacterized protein n=1 Tax=Penicillium canescens TaxID=5083 RepID=UPI0026DEBCAD|nr:uncharacterized protein N7446_010806 [Penicillium canescens]KAJ6050697.1 hypothetical protein N7446_010806 [Penicillium canescens]KAJ6065916.1 hypothetical protein N7444_001569 [Penicillium canescens]